MRLKSVLSGLGFAALVGCATGQTPEASETTTQLGNAAADLGIREYTQLLGLPELSGTPLPRGEIELRIWHGFGLTGTRLLRVQRHAGTWRATEARIARRGYQALESVPDTLDWSERWEQAVAAGIYQLAPEPVRRGAQPRDDGHSYVVEVREGPRYWTAIADNPHVFCSDDDRRLLAVVTRFVVPLDGTCS
jgi:hypothetical protein